MTYPSVPFPWGESANLGSAALGLRMTLGFGLGRDRLALGTVT